VHGYSPVNAGSTRRPALVDTENIVTNENDLTFDQGIIEGDAGSY
jgi:hypothetical protein